MTTLQSNASFPPIKPGKPLLRTTYQLQCDIDPGDDPQATLNTALRIVFAWSGEKYEEPLRFDPLDETFTVDLPGQKFEYVALRDEGIHAFRLEQPDSPLGDKPAIAGRSWITDIAFRLSANRLQFGVRIHCATLPFADGELTYLRPRIVRDLIRSVGLGELIPLRESPHVVGLDCTPEQAAEWCANPARRLPLVILSECNAELYDVSVRRWVLDEDTLASRLTGFAHLMLLPADQRIAFNEAVADHVIDDRGSVTLVLPASDGVEGEVTFRTAGVEEVLFHRYLDKRYEEAYTDWLVHSIGRRNAEERLNWSDLVLFYDAKSRSNAQQRERARAALLNLAETRGTLEQLTGQLDELQRNYEGQIALLRAQVSELSAEAEAFSDNAADAYRTAKELREENRTLRRTNDLLRLQLAGTPAAQLQEPPSYPTTYEDLPAWVGEHLAGRLVLHARAVHSMKDAEYHDVTIVARCLDLLASSYRDSKLGFGEYAAFEAPLEEMHLRCTPSITATAAGQHGDEYYVRHPAGSERRVLLDKHIKSISSPFDRRRCLRIYFFWDEDDGMVVVGSLPGHLKS
jgi:hypothetical protein